MISRLYKTDKWLLVVAVFGSLLLSLWAVQADDILNNDGVEYLKSAQAILLGDWSAAIETYKWPFYSALIGLASTLTGLSLTLSAHAVNAVFYVWLVLAFIALVQLLGGSRSTLWFALLVMLAFPMINKFRPYIIRDPAFLALFLSACYAWFLHLKEGRRRDNVLAISLFIAAALFRLEGLVYLLLVQSYLLSQRLEDTRKRGLYVVMLAGVALLLLMFMSWWLFSSTDELGYASIFTRPVEFFGAAWGQILQPIEYRLEVIEKHILVGFSRSYSVLVLLMSAASMVFVQVLHASYYLYFGVWFLAWRRGLLFPQAELYRPWRYLTIASFVILFGFVVAQWFLTTRYALPVVLLLLLATPFWLDDRYRAIGKKGYRPRVFWVMMALIVLAGLKSLDISTKKHYLKTAAEWMQDNVPAEATIYTNDRILGHYLQREANVGPYWSDWDFFKAAALFGRRYQDYGAINIKHSNADFVENLPQLLRRRVAAEFVNEKGTRVIIFDFTEAPGNERPEPVYIK